VTRNQGLIVGLALLASAAGAGLSLAQDPSNTVVALPPPEAAPPPPVLPAANVPPPEASAPPVATNSEDDKPDRSAKGNETDAGPPPPPPAPLKRPRYTTAVLQALDKVTAETLRFEAKVGEPVRYKDLVITVHACETNAADEVSSESTAHMDVQYQPDVLPTGAARTARQIYRGWMFANSPGLHPLQHPIYDLWVIACKTPSPAAPTPAGASL